LTKHNLFAMIKNVQGKGARAHFPLPHLKGLRTGGIGTPTAHNKRK
jgi:hypothetical protein